MAIPKLSAPTYELELPLSKKRITYRPFLVKEQRNLLMAMESSDATSIQNAVKDVLYNCTLTENLDVEKLPIIDKNRVLLGLITVKDIEKKQSYPKKHPEHDLKNYLWHNSLIV